jgi:hypothetical protein
VTVNCIVPVSVPTTTITIHSGAASNDSPSSFTISASISLTKLNSRQDLVAGSRL